LFLWVFVGDFYIEPRFFISEEPNPPAAPSGAVVHIRINEAEATSGGPWENLSHLK
jgi:hypothetical protein